MNIASMGAMTPMLHTAQGSEAMEGPGPDRDGDADDKSAGSVTQATPLAPKGMGTAVDVQA